MQAAAIKRRKASLVKQRKRSQHVPILFLTAHSAGEDEESLPQGPVDEGG